MLPRPRLPHRHVKRVPQVGVVGLKLARLRERRSGLVVPPDVVQRDAKAVQARHVRLVQYCRFQRVTPAVLPLAQDAEERRSAREHLRHLRRPRLGLLQEQRVLVDHLVAQRPADGVRGNARRRRNARHLVLVEPSCNRGARRRGVASVALRSVRARMRPLHALGVHLAMHRHEGAPGQRALHARARRLGRRDVEGVVSLGSRRDLHRWLHSARQPRQAQLLGEITQLAARPWNGIPVRDARSPFCGCHCRRR
mmetsp:Transcript_17864/g.63057  ORF Transcript_17864/g.63057 Transcript_17864/m.63057 type:complete len:253 (+) Transcript_17864:474-1232(+)